MENYDFEAGEVILIDKPLEWTSFDVVLKIRNLLTKKLKRKKLKVGHAGTLDPLASGLLIVCTGKKTKEIQDFMGLPKQYTAEITVGATTPSYDLETEPVPFDNAKPLTEELIQEHLGAFTGLIEQMPPAFSAKKIKGKKAYDLAREGKEVELKKAFVSIHELTVRNVGENTFELDVHCSKGTYIRSLAHDLGQAMGTGAYLSGLRRTAIGPFTTEDAMSVDEFVKNIG